MSGISTITLLGRFSFYPVPRRSTSFLFFRFPISVVLNFGFSPLPLFESNTNSSPIQKKAERERKADAEPRYVNVSIHIIFENMYMVIYRCASTPAPVQTKVFECTGVSKEETGRLKAECASLVQAYVQLGNSKEHT